MFIPDPGSKRFPDHGSASAKKSSILSQKIVSLGNISSGMFIPDPDLFFFTRTGPGSATLYVSHLVLKIYIFCSRFVMESSYVPVESLIFGRLAYKGMNAEIENLMLEVGLRKNRSPVWDR
jgi:hypothetical protein